MTIFELTVLFISFSSGTEQDLIAERAPNVALAAVKAVEKIGPVFSGPNGIAYTEELLMRMAYLESRGNHKALNKQGDSGILQVNGLTDAERLLVLSSPLEGMMMGLKRLHAAKKACGGNALRWLGAYASGTCGGAPQVARERCRTLGLCMKS